MFLWNMRGGFIDASVTQSVLLVLYLGTWIRMRITARILFVEVLIVLLAISCFTWIMVTHYKYEYAKIADLNMDNCSE
jgi:hypothetical protein